MVKFFMQYYNIPTRKDIDKLMAKMDRLEKMIKSTAAGKSRQASGPRAAKNRARDGRSAATSAGITLDVIKRFRNGVGFAGIQARTGFGEKKLRNIIFRLHKMGKIVRKSRGIYLAS